MNKAFIFDMDGVLVDSQRIWDAEEHEFLTSIFGRHVADKIGSTTGVSAKTVYEKALRYGTTVPKEEYIKKYDEKLTPIYSRAKLTEGADSLVDYLISKHFKIGLVSATRLNGIQKVIRQLPFQEQIEVVIPIDDVAGLRSKPEPDGYLEALGRLRADATRSFVLEDSNPGIAAGKAAGCFVIGYREYLLPNQEQAGADAYAETMDEVIRIVEARNA